MTTQAQLPRYKSLKTLYALKIKFINPINDNIVFEMNNFSPIKVNKQYLTEHQPHVGGYFIIGEDGSQSFSPADEFEDSYALIKN